MNGAPVGLIGIGLVGTALAERLRDAGYAVIGCDRNPARCRALEDRGGTAVESPAAVAKQVETVVLSLPDSSVVRAVIEGLDGLRSAAPRPRFILDTTTGDPDETAAIAASLRGSGVEMLDAPLSGSSQQIRGGAAVIMVGGERRAFDACLPLLETLGGWVFYLGPSGSGMKAKLASNLVLGLNRAALAEGLVFAARLGLDLPSFLELLQASPARSAAMDAKGAKMLARDWSPESRIRQHHKDVAIIRRYAARAGQQLPLTETHFRLLDAALDAGDGDLDNAAILGEIERRRAETMPTESKDHYDR
jgi:3-hydroxyisobutyrate dehydrogenase-like beta-hydroxyacid dehydrogenase